MFAALKKEFISLVTTFKPLKKVRLITAWRFQHWRVCKLVLHWWHCIKQEGHVEIKYTLWLYFALCFILIPYMGAETKHGGITFRTPYIQTWSTIRINAFWDVTLFRVLISYHHFGRISYFHFTYSENGGNRFFVINISKFKPGNTASHPRLLWSSATGVGTTDLKKNVTPYFCWCLLFPSCTTTAWKNHMTIIHHH